MSEVFKTVNRILRFVFIGFVAIAAITKAFDIDKKERTTVTGDEDDFITSEFDEIW